MDSPLSAGDPNIIFVGGTGRSGTNITKDLLAKHPQVATLPFEYRFIIDPDGIVDFYRGYAAVWSPYLADRRLKRLEKLLNTLAGEPLGHRLLGNLIRRLDPRGRVLSPRQYHGWHLNEHLPGFAQLSQELLAKLRAFSFPAFWVGTESYAYRPHVYHASPMSREELASILGRYLCQVIGRFLAKQNKQFFVEDNTWNILVARELIELVPHARILHVYRDPRDVVASFMQQRWSPGAVKEAALWYDSMMKHWFTVRAGLPPGSWYEFSLENLVGDTERVVSEICDFCGIPYDPVLLETDLGRSHTGRWRRDLSCEEHQVAESILSNTLTELGYS
jgi:Sulfotransferase family